MALTFQNLDVYRCSIEFLTFCHRTIPTIPRGHATILDQLKRAATSIPLNIAEASGRTGDSDCARHFAIARGSAMECAATLDVLKVDLLGDGAHRANMELLERIVAMLTKLCR